MLCLRSPSGGIYWSRHERDSQTALGVCVGTVVTFHWEAMPEAAKILLTKEVTHLLWLHGQRGPDNTESCAIGRIVRELSSFLKVY